MQHGKRAPIGKENRCHSSITLFTLPLIFRIFYNHKSGTIPKDLYAAKSSFIPIK